MCTLEESHITDYLLFPRRTTPHFYIHKMMRDLINRATVAQRLRVHTQSQI